MRVRVSEIRNGGIWKEGGYEARGGGEGRGVGKVKGRLTRLMIASWLARWVLQFLQPKILSELR